MVIVFDLDDTLYDDRTYVLSGFHAVANFLSSTTGLSKKLIHDELVQELSCDRNQVFDRFLTKRGIYSKSLVMHCLSIYRAHKPNIRLFPEADACLNRFKNVPLYVVTDGNKLVQKNKCLALGLDLRVKKCICTSVYGLKHAKPSPYCFQRICEWENVNPQDVVYIADNPKKDFVGIKPLGFQTIRVLTGPYRDLVVDPKYDADRTISSLKECVL